MGKFDKNSACEYCKNEMTASYRSKRFCSDKCRIYFRRENVKLNVPKTIKSVSVLENIVTEVPSKKELKNDEIFIEIQRIKSEVIQKERDKYLGRKSWKSEQDAKIKELMSKLITEGKM